MYMNNPGQFIRTYGDMFVQGFTTGAAYYGVLQIHTTSTTAQSNMAAGLSAAIGPIGASLGISISDIIRHIIGNAETEIFCHVEGPLIPSPTSLDTALLT